MYRSVTHAAAFVSVSAAALTAAHVCVLPAGGDLRFGSTTSSEPASAASSVMNTYFDTLMVLAASDPEVRDTAPARTVRVCAKGRCPPLLPEADTAAFPGRCAHHDTAVTIATLQGSMGYILHNAGQAIDINTCAWSRAGNACACAVSLLCCSGV